MSQLELEINQIPAQLSSCCEAASEQIEQAVDVLAKPNIAAIFTIARGSSAAAGNYIAARIAILTGTPVGIFYPSLATMEGFKTEAAVGALAISQSGASPDLATALDSFPKANRVALVNVADSVLAKVAATEIAIGAGAELSVAATKSFACSLAVGEMLALSLAGKQAEIITGQQLAEAATAGIAKPAKLDLLASADNVYVLGRSSTLPLAEEVALKLKELTGLAAEAISSAEVMHGPKALAGAKLSVVYLAANGPSGDDTRQAAQKFAEYGSPVIGIESVKGDGHLLGAIRIISSFYAAVGQLAKLRQRDPDNSPMLSKVTLTN